MSNLRGTVKGLHHITLVTSNQDVNRRFYTEILGLRRVKLTVNQDDVLHRHLFYADERGTTGTAITFFEWPGLPRGNVGLSAPHHLSYLVSNVDVLPSWRAWLTSHGLPVVGPLTREERLSLYLRDPDGVLIEITATNPEGVPPEYFKDRNDTTEAKQITPAMKLIRFEHASPITSDPRLTSKFLDKLVGLDSYSEHPNPDQEGTLLARVGTAERPAFLNYLASSDSPVGFVGKGGIHHIAMAVDEDEDQRRIMRSLDDAGIGNSGIVDRFWFKSLYFRDPDGNLLEVATKKPGYSADEPAEKLGTSLVLPEWLESSRGRIEEALKEQDRKGEGTWPPSYEPVPTPPESLGWRRRANA